MNGYKYIHVATNDSIELFHSSSVSSFCYGLFSTIGSQLIIKDKIQLAIYSGIKVSYGANNFQFYLPLGSQIGKKNKKNKYIGVSAEYNFLLKPSYTKIVLPYPDNGIVEPYVSEIKTYNNYISFDLYYRIPF